MSRDELKESLKNKGITTMIYYPLPIDKQPLYRKLNYNDFLPCSEKLAKGVLSLPVHPSLTKEELKYIVQTIKDI